MKLSEIKEVVKLTGQSIAEIRSCDFFKNFEEDPNDFRLDFGREEWRFIKASEIDKILEEELGYDDYILGCFKAEFLSDITGLDTELIEIIQQADKFEKLGKYLRENDFIEKIASEYSSQDGYGHHFSSYDGNEYELTFDGVDYLAFRTN